MPCHVLPRISYITSFYFNQGDVRHLYDLLSRYNACPAAIMQYIQFILVDDCSMESVVLPSQINLNIKLLRITDDILWNQPGARNLGATLASTSKILLTDIDHYIPQELLKMLLESPVPYRQLYIFERTKESGEKINCHINTFFTSKSVFFKSLGYDEQFCGNYGHDDSMFFYCNSLLAQKLLISTVNMLLHIWNMAEGITLLNGTARSISNYMNLVKNFYGREKTRCFVIAGCF
jgi:hypothetical protein